MKMPQQSENSGQAKASQNHPDPTEFDSAAFFRGMTPKKWENARDQRDYDLAQNAPAVPQVFNPVDE